MDIGVAEDAAERSVDGHTRPIREVGLDVLDPAVCSVGEGDVPLPAAAAAQIEVLDAGVFHRRDHRAVVDVREARQLRGESLLERDVEWRGEGHGAAAHRLDFHDLANWSVGTGEPGPRGVAGRRLGAPLGDARVSELVDLNDFARGETTRDARQHRTRTPLDRVGGEVGGLGELEVLGADVDQVCVRSDRHLQPCLGRPETAQHDPLRDLEGRRDLEVARRELHDLANRAVIERSLDAGGRVLRAVAILSGAHLGAHGGLRGNPAADPRVPRRQAVCRDEREGAGCRCWERFNRGEHGEDPEDAVVLHPRRAFDERPQ